MLRFGVWGLRLQAFVDVGVSGACGVSLEDLLYRMNAEVLGRV